MLARGPEGTAWAKEVEDHVSAAASHCELKLSGTTAVSPDSAALSIPVRIKHQVKSCGRRIGISYPQPDRAEDYLLVIPETGVMLHCVARISGDHLIGIDLHISASDRSIAHCLRSALRKEFRGHDFSLLITEET